MIVSIKAWQIEASAGPEVRHHWVIVGVQHSQDAQEFGTWQWVDSVKVRKIPERVILSYVPKLFEVWNEHNTAPRRLIDISAS